MITRFDCVGLGSKTRDNYRGTELGVLALYDDELYLGSNTRWDIGIFLCFFDARKCLTSKTIGSIYLVGAMFGLAYFDFEGDLDGVKDGDAYFEEERWTTQTWGLAGAAGGARRVEYYSGGIRVRPIFILSFDGRVLYAGVIETYDLDDYYLITLNGGRYSCDFAYAIKGGGDATGLLIDIT